MAASSLPCRLLSMSNEARLEGSEEGFLVRDGAVMRLAVIGEVLN